MGGCDVDLRDAVPTTDPIAIQVFAMWGGIDIRIPPGWIVEIEAWPILGGVVDNTQAPALPSPPRDPARHGVHGRRRDQELIAGARRPPPCIRSSPAAT